MDANLERWVATGGIWTGGEEFELPIKQDMPYNGRFLGVNRALEELQNGWVNFTKLTQFQQDLNFDVC